MEVIGQKLEQLAHWKQVELREVATPVARKTPVEFGSSYRTLGVKWWGEGAYERARIDGSRTSAKTLNRVEIDDLIINKIWVRNGSIAVVDDRVGGCYGSNEFPTFQLDTDRILPRWMHWYSKSRDLWRKCAKLSRGTSGKNRIRPEKFLSVKIPLPPLPEQELIVSWIDRVASMNDRATELYQELEKESQGLMRSVFSKLVEGCEFKCMNEVAPLVRRKTAIEVGRSYPELGVRCFGKGTFHKPSLDATAVGNKKLYSIEPGDLVFSNVFAWEGAIAVAQEKDVGRFGSHRFITCVPTLGTEMSEFLAFYFLTPAGLGQIGDASPGGAGRNRTLGLKKLAALEVPVPHAGKLRWFCNLLHRYRELNCVRDEIRQKRDALIPAILDRAFKGEL